MALRLAVGRPLVFASAARLVAVFAGEAVVIALLAMRFSLVDYRIGAGALAACMAVASLALLFAVAAFVKIWRSGAPGFGRAFAGFLLALLLLVPAGLVTARVLARPSVVDVTTDESTPPSVAFSRAERRWGANPVAYDARAFARQQALFPQIRSLLSDLPADDLLKLAERLVREKRWSVVTAPTPETLAGSGGPVTIEAVVKSTMLGTVDDVAIRITDLGGQARVDMRSASRYLPYDFDVNGRRVEDFLEELRVRALAPPPPSEGSPSE